MHFLHERENFKEPIEREGSAEGTKEREREREREGKGFRPRRKEKKRVKKGGVNSCLQVV